MKLVRNILSHLPIRGPHTMQVGFCNAIAGRLWINVDYFNVIYVSWETWYLSLDGW